MAGPPNDPRRVKPSFGEEAGRILLQNKALLEEIHGPLTWDEFILKMQAYVDITPKERVSWLHKELHKLARETRMKGEPTPADLIEYFADLARDVMTGKVSADDAEDAILNAGLKHD